jgi:hypothetical protein
MNSSQFSKVIFIQALEQSDPQAHFISHATRQRATQQAKRDSPTESPLSVDGSTRFISHRAEYLWNVLSSSYPGLTGAFQGIPVDIPSFMVIIPTFTAGLFINGLGTSQRVNLLNFPLLLLLLWNFAIYTLSLLSPLLQRASTGPLIRFMSRIMVKLSGIVGKASWPISTRSGNTGKEWVQQSSERFITLWWRQGHPVIISRVRHLFHLGAACLALGIIVSMYFRGLVLDYRATWESTFLSPPQVHALLKGLLGPAALVLDFPFPQVNDIVRLQAPGHGSAAPWIHLWALTGMAGIVLPRLIFAGISARSAQKAAESFTLPLEEPYYLQLLTGDRGQGIQIDIIPYSYQPSPAALALLGKCLMDLFGSQATLQWHTPLSYGQESGPWLQTSSSSHIIVLVCNLAQTPEAEVHGEIFHMLQEYIHASEGQHQVLLTLDQQTYKHIANAAQITERQQTWQRLAHTYHLQMVPFDAGETSRDQFLLNAQAAVWPSRRYPT